MGKIELHQLFSNLQQEMIAKLKGYRKSIVHSGAKGEAGEEAWRRLMRDYLPSRYRVESAFILDSRGETSDQIDVVIFDRQYSPFLLNNDGLLYVPAESVYAVLEVKQDLNKGNIEYAGAKVESVRKLHRTSSPITWIGGTSAPREPFNIVGGILTLDTTWDEPFGLPFKSSITELDPSHRLEIGSALNCGTFLVAYREDAPPDFYLDDEENALAIFLLRLMKCLQELGTVPALDIDEYLKAFSSSKK